jgi:hypothetical protein
MSFILFFVIKVQSSSKYDNELVTDDYYKKEATVQNDIEKQQNALKLETKVSITKNEEGIVIAFPPEFNAEFIKGKVSLYRPSDQKLDFEIPISISTPYLLIPKNSLVDGLWDITIDWSYNSTDYMNKETIYF